MIEFNHKPIMLKECIDGLNIKPDGTYLDCTVGGAGHSFCIAQKLGVGGKLVCLDKDDVALSVSKERLKQFDNVQFYHTDFKDFENAKEKFGISKFDGILVDLGISSYQIDTAERGFSYLKDARLDMRMDRSQALSAYDIVNTWTKQDLAKIFREYGEEMFAHNIAKHIVEARETKPVETTLELAKIIEISIPAKIRFKGGHPAKKVFQALRIAVNKELDRLYETILDLARSLNPKGRMAVLSFHSLEDRIVKQAFNFLSSDCICSPQIPVCVCNHKKEIILVNKKPIIADKIEQDENPRSHSAKLRIVEKI